MLQQWLLLAMWHGSMDGSDIYFVQGPTLARQPLQFIFFLLFWMQAYLNFCFIAEAQYEDVKDECLKRITNGFTVIHVMKAIL